MRISDWSSDVCSSDVLYWDDLNRLYNLVHPDQFQDLKDLMHACDHGYMGRQDSLESVAELAGISVEAVTAVMHDKHRRNEPIIARAKEIGREQVRTTVTNAHSV